MSGKAATDEVTDLIANIEMHRQEIEKESGLGASRSYALRRLQLALRQMQEETQADNPGSSSLADIEALTLEIRRVEKLAESARQRPAMGRTAPGAMKKSWRDGQRKSAQSRGRNRTGRGPAR